MRGYIRKRGQGYQVEIYLGLDENDRKLRHLKTLSNRKAAEKYLRDKLTEFEGQGAIRAQSNETLEGYLRRWLEAAARPGVRQRTFENYRAILEREIFGSPIGRRPIRTITPLDVQELYGSIQERIRTDGRGTGAQSVRYLHAVLRKALNQAVQWRELPMNPCLSVSLPKREKTEKPVVHTEDFPLFIRAAPEEKRIGVMWVVALASGARPEEYLAWKWTDVDWRHCGIHIVRALVRPLRLREGEPRWRLEPVKTDESRRFVELDEQVMFLLRRHQAEQTEEQLKAASAYADHGFVFADELGEPLRQDYLCKRVFKRVIDRAGLDPSLTPYCLRHSCATGLINLGEDIKDVACQLGHASTTFTYDTYVARKKSLSGTARKMGQALFGDCGEERRRSGRQ